MLATFFSWLRRKSREAVVAGVQDAIVQLDGDSPDDLGQLELEFRDRVLALPSAEKSKKPKGA